MKTKRPDGPDQREERIVALLAGEVSTKEAVELRRLMETDPSLMAFYNRMSRTMGLVRAAAEESTSPGEEPKLSETRRAAILTRFKQPVRRVMAKPQRRELHWSVPLALAAAVIFLLGGLMVPTFVKSKARSQRNAAATVAFHDYKEGDRDGSSATFTIVPGPLTDEALGASDREGSPAAENRFRDYSDLGTTGGGQPQGGRAPAATVEATPARRSIERFGSSRPTSGGAAPPPPPPSAQPEPTQERLIVTNGATFALEQSDGQTVHLYAQPAETFKRMTNFIAANNSQPVDGAKAEANGRGDLNLFLAQQEVAADHGIVPVPVTGGSRDQLALSFNGGSFMKQQGGGGGGFGIGGANGPVSSEINSSGQPLAENYYFNLTQNRPAISDGFADFGGIAQATPQISLEAKFADISQDDKRAVGFDWFLGNQPLASPPPVDPSTGLPAQLDGRVSGRQPGRQSSVPGAVPETPKSVSQLAESRISQLNFGDQIHPTDKPQAVDSLSRAGDRAGSAGKVIAGVELQTAPAPAVPPSAGVQIYDAEGAQTTVTRGLAVVPTLTPPAKPAEPSPSGPESRSGSDRFEAVRESLRRRRALGRTEDEVRKLNESNVAAGEVKAQVQKLPEDAKKAKADSSGRQKELSEQLGAVKDKLEDQVLLEELEKANEPAEVEAALVLAKRPASAPLPEVQTQVNPFSTFSLNVSDVSFKLAAATLEQGQMPEPGGIRSEEFINAFNYHDSPPSAGERVSLNWERARHPSAHNRDLIRLSVQTAAWGREQGRPLNLVLLLDNSGSMERSDRVLILRQALQILAHQLTPQDRISVVAFARTPRLWVDGLAGGNPDELWQRVGRLNPEGGTNLELALHLGYETAAKHFMEGGVNRVILMTDGAANLGNVNADELKQKVEAERKKNIALDCFGIGWEGFNDELLEQLSRNGDGRYGFINSPAEAATEFAGQLAGALRVAAADVKAQIEFNPERVTTYRQIGYEKHQLTKEQFRDNTVDAAEIGAAESGTALYAIQVNPKGRGPLGVARVRYKVPETGRYEEREWLLSYSPAVPTLEAAPPSMRLASVAGIFAEVLAQNPYAAGVTLADLERFLNGVPQFFPRDERPRQLTTMLQQARRVSGQ